MSEVLNEAVEMCPTECCGKPVTECKCGPDCPHCDCYSKNQAMKETTTAGAVASSMGGSNGFANGGPGTLSRVSTKKKRKKKQN